MGQTAEENEITKAATPPATEVVPSAEEAVIEVTPPASTETVPTIEIPKE